MNKVTCFIIDSADYDVEETIKEFRNNSDAVKNIFVLSKDNIKYKGAETILVDNFDSTENLKAVQMKAYSMYIVLYTDNAPIKLSPYCIDRMISVAKDVNAGLVYSDSYQMRKGELRKTPRLEFQKGSIRNDFDFGPVMFFNSEAYTEAINNMFFNCDYAALYDLVLKVSQKRTVLRLQEYLYTELNPCSQINNQPNLIAIQEVQKVCTFHLKATGAWIKPKALDVDFTKDNFPVEASIVIYTQNAENTVVDAVKSALSQKTNFSFNVIVIDNHSTDNTQNILQGLVKENPKLIYVAPKEDNLEIGGCYNVGIEHPKCGRFTIKLDSTDVCINDKVLTTIVEAFYEQKCAMLVGSYKTVDFNLKEIPPGVVDSKDWTPENIRSVLLRPDIGKPRAFFTPAIRERKFPNTNYLEGYAVALAISREYRIGRIYTPLYLCRKMDTSYEETVAGRNKHNSYVDKIRSIEIMSRTIKNNNSALELT